MKPKGNHQTNRHSKQLPQAFAALLLAWFGMVFQTPAQTNIPVPTGLTPIAVFSEAVGGFSTHGSKPAIIPGTATITITTRGSDGSIPFGSTCDVSPRFVVLSTLAQGPSVSVLPTPQNGRSNTPVRTPPPRPVITGSNGNWVAYNVTAGELGWSVRIADTNYAPLEHGADQQIVHVASNGNVAVSFTLPLWASASFHVVDAETGRPIEGARAYCGYDRGATDISGTLTLKHLTTNDWISVRAPSLGYVAQQAHLEAREGEKVTLPDVKLSKGGWISGRAIPPADAPSVAGAGVVVEPDTTGVSAPSVRGEWFPNPPFDEFFATNGVFRIGPFPPGTYRLHTIYNLGKSPDPWLAEGASAGIKVEAGRETSNIVVQAKTITPSNGRTNW